MRDNPRIGEALAGLVPGEYEAQQFYVVHSRLCASWGFVKLAERLLAEAAEELGHAQLLLDRLLFFGQVPPTGSWDEAPCLDVPSILSKGLSLEMGVRAAYLPALALCREADDAVSWSLLAKIQADTEDHVLWLETQIHLLKTLGPANYLQIWV